MEFNCTTCNHPVCPMKNKSDHYCGNFVMAKPYALRIFKGVNESEQSIKDGVCTGNGDAVLNNYCVGRHDLTANY